METKYHFPDELSKESAHIVIDAIDLRFEMYSKSEELKGKSEKQVKAVLEEFDQFKDDLIRHIAHLARTEIRKTQATVIEHQH